MTSGVAARRGFRVALAMLAAAQLGCASSPRIPFPPGTLPEFESEWYSSQLEALGERRTLEAEVGRSGHGYRFTWLRTFHPPLCFVLTISADGSGFLRSAEASGMGGYEPGSLASTESRRLPAREVDGFLAALEKADFWNLKMERPVTLASEGQTEDQIHADGAQWILEGVRNGRYHLVDRWSPHAGPYREALLQLVALARKRVDPVY